jgi:hypothetical protein
MEKPTPNNNTPGVEASFELLSRIASDPEGDARYPDGTIVVRADSPDLRRRRDLENHRVLQCHDCVHHFRLVSARGTRLQYTTRHCGGILAPFEKESRGRSSFIARAYMCFSACS